MSTKSLQSTDVVRHLGALEPAGELHPALVVIKGQHAGANFSLDALPMKAQFPQSEMPRWSLATTYEDADRFQEAIAEFRELVAIKPDYCVAFLHLGSCLIEEEAYDEAIAALEEAKRLAVAQGHDEPRLKAEALIAIAEDERDD